ncbi:DNA circularization N-terminal domain-containing protein [Pasteurella multocida]|nr:DNA circularization N-terminal domain-containing protein [Pasteurella multocida]
MNDKDTGKGSYRGVPFGLKMSRSKWWTSCVTHEYPYAMMV